MARLDLRTPVLMFGSNFCQSIQAPPLMLGQTNHDWEIIMIGHFLGALMKAIFPLPCVADQNNCAMEQLLNVK